MKIAYVANARIPTEKAHGLQIMKTCEALHAAGHDVTLIVPSRKNRITADPFDYYKIKTKFPMMYLKNPDFVEFGFLGYMLQTFLFSRKAKKYVRENKFDAVLGRDEIVLAPISSIAPVVWETHIGSVNSPARKLLKQAKGVIAITQGLKDFYVSAGMAVKNMSVIPDAVDISEFDISIDKKSARVKLHLPEGKKLVIYTGHLYGWKGADVLAQSAQFLPQDFQVIFVGGTHADITRFKERYGNNQKIKIIGHEPHEKMPFYLKMADVLVVPNTAKNKVSEFYTSPMKVFEYMTSNTPIVASDLPSIREVLNESNAFLVTADDPEALAKGIISAVSAEGRNRAHQARLDVAEYSWTKRAEKIIAVLSQAIK